MISIVMGYEYVLKSLPWLMSIIHATIMTQLISTAPIFVKRLVTRAIPPSNSAVDAQKPQNIGTQVIPRVPRAEPKKVHVCCPPISLSTPKMQKRIPIPVRIIHREMLFCVQCDLFSDSITISL